MIKLKLFFLHQNHLAFADVEVRGGEALSGGDIDNGKIFIHPHIALFLVRCAKGSLHHVDGLVFINAIDLAGDPRSAAACGKGIRFGRIRLTRGRQIG